MGWDFLFFLRQLKCHLTESSEKLIPANTRHFKDTNNYWSAHLGTWSLEKIHAFSDLVVLRGSIGLQSPLTPLYYSWGFCPAPVYFHICIEQQNAYVPAVNGSKSFCIKISYQRHGGRRDNTSFFVYFFFFFLLTAGNNNKRRNIGIQHPSPSLTHFQQMLILHTEKSVWIEWNALLHHWSSGMMIYLFFLATRSCTDFLFCFVLQFCKTEWEETSFLVFKTAKNAVLLWSFLLALILLLFMSNDEKN